MRLPELQQAQVDVITGQALTYLGALLGGITLIVPLGSLPAWIPLVIAGVGLVFAATGIRWWHHGHHTLTTNDREGGTR